MGAKENLDVGNRNRFLPRRFFCRAGLPLFLSFSLVISLSLFPLSSLSSLSHLSLPSLISLSPLSPLPSHSSNFLKMIELLCPPNPNEFERATFVSRSR